MLWFVKYLEKIFNLFKNTKSFFLGTVTGRWPVKSLGCFNTVAESEVISHFGC